MANAYNCTFVLENPANERLVSTFFQVAEDDADALLLSKAQISEAEFTSNTRNWTIIAQTIKEIHREDIEQAAIEVLGWHPPKT